MAAKKKPKKCLAKKCGRDAVARGLCKSCHASALRMFAAAKADPANPDLISEDKAICRGLILPSANVSPWLADANQRRDGNV